MKYKLVGLVMCLGMLVATGCLKKEEDLYAQNEVRLQADESIIQQFLKDNGISATRHESGIYYQIIEPGEGDVVYTANTQIEVKYTGRLLNGKVFDQTKSNTTFKSPLSKVIYGWRIGLQFVQKGGKIRLFIPSVYAYGNNAVGIIPANAVLDFDIEVIDIN